MNFFGSSNLPKKIPPPTRKVTEPEKLFIGKSLCLWGSLENRRCFRLFCEGVVEKYISDAWYRLSLIASWKSVVFVFFHLDFAIGFLLKSALVPVILDILRGVTSPEAVTWCHRGRWLWQLLSCMVGIDMKESCFWGHDFQDQSLQFVIFFRIF